MTTISRRDFVKGAALSSLSVNAGAFEGTSVSDSSFDFVVAGAGHNSLITAA